MKGHFLDRMQTFLFAMVVVGAAAAAVAEAAPERRAVPAELRGDWVFGNISPTDFYDGATGRHLGNAYGMAVYFTFEPDGGFKQLQYHYSTTYSCRIETWTQLEGTVAFEDGVFRTYTTKGHYRVANNCAKSQNYSRQMTASERADAQGKLYSWGFEQNADDGKTYLMIGPGGGDARSHFRRPS